MQIGPQNWKAVSVGSSGVPSGGRYGNVKRAVKKLKNIGCSLAWSWRGRCFFVYEQKGPLYICHLNFLDGEGDPLPITDDKLNYLRWQQEQFGHIKSKKQLHAASEQAKRDVESDKRNATNKWWDDRKNAIMARAKRLSGAVGAPMISIPKTLGRV
jgi:hypothetical protein